MILRLDNDIAQIDRLDAFVKNVVTDHSVTDDYTKLINLALEEAVSNVLFYSECTWVEISAHTDHGSLVIFITDDGKAFNPCMHNDKSPDQMLTPGGLGITLMRKIMDAVHYDRLPGRNLLLMTKNLLPAC